MQRGIEENVCAIHSTTREIASQTTSAAACSAGTHHSRAATIPKPTMSVKGTVSAAFATGPTSDTSSKDSSETGKVESCATTEAPNPSHTPVDSA